MYLISADGRKAEKIAVTGGFCLGITLDREEREENVYICDAGRRSLLRVSRRGNVTVGTAALALASDKFLVVLVGLALLPVALAYESDGSAHVVQSALSQGFAISV